MRFIVATRSFLAEVGVGAEWNLVDFHRIARGQHYGLALPRADGSRFLAMAKRDPVVLDYERSREDARTVHYRERSSIELGGPCDDTHQIAYVDEGIYLANSGFNSLDFLPLDGSPPARLFFDEWGSRHVNSVYPCGRSLVVATLHNKGTKTSEIAVVRRRPSGVLELVNRLRTWDMGCHNVYVDDDVIVYNASEVGDFLIVDAATGRPRRRIHFPGHTKGLSVTRDHYVIGLSEYASRWARNTSYGYLVAIDRRTLRVRATVDLNHPSLPHPIGNVNEIRCVSEPETGHASAHEPNVDLDHLELDPGLPREQLWLRSRRVVITGIKTAKTLGISVRERARRAMGTRASPP